MNIVVTGAGGLIGIPVIRYFADAGHHVRALARSPRSISFGHPLIEWRLGDIRDEQFLSSATQGMDYVVHLAGDKADEAESFEVNVLGTEKLLAACEAARVRGIIYASTVSVKFTTTGIYGSTKRAAEERVRVSSLHSVILRLSVVYADSKTGILGTLARYARLPLVPIIGTGASTFRPIHADDVAVAIGKIIEKGIDKKTEYELGGPDLVSLNELATLVGTRIARKKIRILHIPASIGLIIARTLSKVMKRPPITVSNALGMIQDAEVDPSPFCAVFDFHPHGLDQGISNLLSLETTRSAEPYVIMRYALKGMQPGDQLADLYSRSQRRMGTDRYHIPEHILKSPFLLGATDAFTKITDKRGILQQKFCQAAILAECSPLSSDWLLPKKHSLPGIILIWTRIGLQAAILFLAGSLLLQIDGSHIKNHE